MFASAIMVFAMVGAVNADGHLIPADDLRLWLKADDLQRPDYRTAI